MAGSLEMMRHDIKNCEGFTDCYCLIENMGDAWEACEEAIAELERLEGALREIIVAPKCEMQRIAIEALDKKPISTGEVK